MRTIGTIVAAMVLTGCVAQAQVPTRMSEPKMIVAAAQEKGAANNPEAQLHLKLAKDRIRQAERLLHEGDRDDAELLLLRAEADAEYALALLRRDETRHQAERLQMQIDELHSEMETATQ